MDKPEFTHLAQIGLFSLGDIQSAQTPPMESTTYVVENFDNLPSINNNSLTRPSSRIFEGLYYGGVDTPTTRQLAARMAAIEKGNFSVLTASGQNAFHLLLSATAKPGDHILVGDTIIYTTQWLLSHFQSYGLDIEYFTPKDALSIRKKLKPKTKVIIWENPGAFTYEIIDSRAIIESCKNHPAITAVDNTWAASTFYHPLELGADVSLVSMSKSHAATEGVSLGALITKRDDVFSILKTTSALIGNHVSSYACAAALRSISTLGARLTLQMHTTRLVIDHFKALPLARRVLHPIVQNSKSDLYEKNYSGFNSIITVQFSCSRDELIARLNQLKIIKIGYGWGGTISLANLVDTTDMPSANRLSLNGSCVRFYLGLEDPYDLIKDIKNSFSI
ncbi:PLP-dependent transferase [Pseudomonas guariconensis]|uniref:PLP-dependent transferase n=1 Tax=Pseudomonas TaxID=286 RepID=UPI002097E50E|nr:MULTISPECIES: PLP-dependent transferase [Pseudomonas]MCO7643042.1 PLP-dependent transferase [Pseudomonas sp. S 311-6]MCO7516183.1 PLP-dependent transferase [Pseudomonas putida]MCO7567703.1 PLP-dependent transferase [Pseudomonas mosselii]MCO7597505.1 PLP-dependent transferase [Pseudomonas guariconensis]MCO7606023.1 PLP-dependent transferase [Pseudomonas guariconensis]